MFGEIIKELRKEKKMTQSEISHMIGVNQNTYSGYENNKSEPDVNTLIKLADIFKVSLDYLTGRYSQK